MAFDLLEDPLAFFYASSGREKPSTTDRTSCAECGAELKENEEGCMMRCPNCEEQSDC